MNNYSDAQNLASYGREGDSQLVHMSPSEVRGLQALAMANGGSLTINPDTGLVEAFSLKRLIPMAAGAALSPFITPVGAAAVVGGVYGASTGSVRQGIMAGIGAYGGAGLTTGLANAAGSTAVEASAVNALGVPASAGTVATGAGSQVGTLAAQNASLGLTPLESAANIASSGSVAAGAVPMSAAGQTVDLASSGIGQLGTSAGRSAAYAAMPMGTLPATALSLALPESSSSSVPGYQEDEYDRRLKGYRLSPNFQSSAPVRPNPYYRPVYAAEGGVMNSYDDMSGMDEAAGMDQGNLQNGLLGLGYAAGGLSIGGYSDGGRMLKGPGDGMSDSIPGIIGGKQPARLADGEFVVPADVVSHLGNGSTDGGAKKLYSMMDKIRKARTGKKRQAPEVDADKYLPIRKSSGGITGYAEGGIAGYAAGGTTFSDAQVAQALAESVAQGFTVAQSIQGGMQNFGISQEQADRAAAIYSGGGGNAPSGGGGGGGAPSVAPSGGGNVSDSVIKSAVIDMMNSNVGGAEIGRALAAMGISQEQATRATGLGADIIAQSYAGGASLSPISSASGLPTRPALNSAGQPIIPSFTDAQAAAYLRDNQFTTAAQQADVFRMFNIQPDQQARALALIARNDPSIQAATDAYIRSIQADPNLALQNALTTANRRNDLGLAQIIPPRTVIPTKPLTPEEEDLSRLGTGPYRPSFVPRTVGVNTSAEVLDPFSDAGLKTLYGQMMDQYTKPPPPISDKDVRDIVRKYVGNGAEVGRQLINAGIPMNQAISALQGYPQLTPEIINQSYLGGQALGAVSPPTLDTQYMYSDPATYYKPLAPNNLILSKPIVDAAFQTVAPPTANNFFTAPSGQIFANEAAYNASVGSAPGGKAGGLMSIDRKKRARIKKG